MDNPIEIPVKGAPLRVQWGANVANRLNSIGSFCPSGMLLSEGATGTGFAALPKNLRDRRTTSPDRSCFCIRASSNPSDDGALVFCNCYVSDGMVFEKACEDGVYKVGDFVLQGELEEGQEYTEGDKPFVYVEYYGGAFSIDAKKTLEEVSSLANDPTQGTVILLYQLKHDGSVAVDFRNMPIFQHVEAI